MNLFAFLPPSKIESLESTRIQKSNIKLPQSLALLLGPKSTIITSLLYQYAYNEASKNKKVVYIGNRSKIQSSLQIFGEGMSYDNKVLNSIDMIYYESGAVLRSYFAHLHLLTAFPNLIIIDDLPEIVGKDKIELFKSLAFIRDAADYISTLKNPDSDGPFDFNILLSSVIDLEAPTRKIEIYQQWISLFFILQGQHNPFRLVAQDTKNNEDPLCSVSVTFQFEENTFRFLEIID